MQEDHWMPYFSKRYYLRTRKLATLPNLEVMFTVGMMQKNIIQLSGPKWIAEPPMVHFSVTNSFRLLKQQHTMERYDDWLWIPECVIFFFREQLS